MTEQEKKLLKYFLFYSLDVLDAIKKIKDTSKLMKLKFIKKEEPGMFFYVGSKFKS